MVHNNDFGFNLREWIADAKDYQKWRVRWFNPYKRDVFGRPAERRQSPPPPEWMAEQCRVLAFYTPRPEPSTLQARSVQARQEDEAHSSFWDRIYVDGLWPMVNSSSTVFGVAGVHTGFWSLVRVSPTKVHFTIAKAFVAATTPMGRVTTVDLAGFSFTSGRER